MADEPRAINNVQHAAILGAAHIIAFYNQTIEGTVRAIAQSLGIEPSGTMTDYYGKLSDELTSAGLHGQSPESVTANVMHAYNLVVDDPLPPRDPTKPTRWSAGA